MSDLVKWLRLECGRVGVKAADRIEQLEELVSELADDLEVEVKARWGYDDRLKRQLDRDMDVVNRARAALGDD